MEIKTQDNYLYFPIIILATSLLYKLIQFYRILDYFPFAIGDLTHRMGQFFLFAKYGFLQQVPTWYNGFISLKFYPPMWYFFTYPFYLITGNINLTMLLSLVFILVISFLFILYFGKLVRLSLTKRIAMFFLFFGSPLVVDQLFNIGKFPEFFGWMLFIPLFFIFVYYKNHKLDLKFFVLFVFFYSLILLTHPFLWPGVSFFFLGFFLLKSFKEKILMIFALILSFLLASFWLVPFITGISDQSGCNFICFDLESYIGKPEIQTHHVNPLRELLFPGSIVSFSTLISIAFLIIFLFYWNSTGKERNTLLFYSPLAFLSIAILTRLIIFLPLLNKSPIGSYSTLLLFTLIFLFLKIKYHGIYKNFAILLVFLIPISFIIANFAFIDNESIIYSDLDNEFVKIADNIESRYLFIMPLDKENDYLKISHISYVTLHKPNLTTPSGAFHTNAREGLLEELNSIAEDFESLNCESAVDKVKKQEVRELASYGNFCNSFEHCNLELKEKTDNYCIYHVK